MNVTMRDVANKLGISQSTVSLALRNSPKLRSETIEKVRAVALELGYLSNPYVSALMASRRNGKSPDCEPTIALVTAGDTVDKWKSRLHHRRVAASCSLVARSFGIKLEPFWLGADNMTASRMNDVLYCRGIRGAILFPFGTCRERFDHQWKDIATISFGVYSIRPATDRVAPDYYGNMEMTRRILCEQGFKRLGFAMDRAYIYANDNRWLAAYLMAHQKSRMQPIAPWIDPEPTFEGFKTWLKKVRPDAIICVHAPTVIKWLQKMGLRVPDDISVVSIGSTEDGTEVSGIVENARMCGKLALEQLLHRIHQNELGPVPDPQQIMVSGHWNRGSTVCYRQGAR